MDNAVTSSIGSNMHMEVPILWPINNLQIVKEIL